METRPSCFRLPAFCLILTLVGTALGFAASAARLRSQPLRHTARPPAHPDVQATLARLPMRFEANQGQTDPQVKFLTRGPGYTLFLTPGEAVLRLSSPSGTAESPGATGRRGNGAAGHGSPRHRCSVAPLLRRPVAPPATLRFSLAGANRTPEVSGVGELPGRSHYFVGSDRSRWRTNLPGYARVRYEGVYPGIDLLYYGKDQQLEYDFVVAPGADPSQIRLQVQGARRVTLDRKGDLLLHTPAGVLRQRQPLLYQEVNGQRRPVAGGYVLGSAKGKGQRAEGSPSGAHCASRSALCEVAFQVGPYDRTRPLVIDPVLLYSTYLGGGDVDSAFDVAVDGANNILLTGRTASVNFPTGSPAQAANGGGYDLFVSKLDAGGASLVYSTYLGGSEYEEASGIAMDGAGNAFVAGSSSSLNFPTLGALYPNLAGGLDAILAKLSPGGTLLFSTYLGGAGTDPAIDVDLDSNGNPCIVGYTDSTNLPTTVGVIQPTRSDLVDAFAARIDAAGAALLFCTYLGGNGDDYGHSVAHDAADNVYLVGITDSSTFPTANPFQANLGGGQDAFVTKLNPTATTLEYSTFLGGTNADRGYGIDVDAAGRACVVGQTDSANFPTRDPAQPTNRGAGDAFFTRLAPAGNALEASSFLGGTGTDVAQAVALEDTGRPCVVGWTTSNDFPSVSSIQTFRRGSTDFFITQYTAAGTGIDFSSYLGGTLSDYAYGVALDGGGNLHVAGTVDSTNFPLANPIQAANNGTWDAVLAKISRPSSSLPAPPANLSARAVSQTRIDLLWFDASFNEDTYEVERRNPAISNSFERIAVLGRNANTYQDTNGLAANTLYDYRVRAVNATGPGPYSNVSSARTLENPPAAPTNLTATAVSQTQINLAWQDNSSNERGFRVERSTDGGNTWTLVITLNANTVSYADTNRTPNTTYHYRVGAYNTGDAAYSNVAFATTLPGYSLIATPAEVQPGGALSVSWTAPPGRPAADWIGLYRVGDPNTAYGWWQYTQGAQSGSFNLAAPIVAGNYEFRYLQNNGFTSVAASNPVQVLGGGTPGYTLTASPATLAPGDPLAVTWTAPAGRPGTDWIGLYRVGDPNTAYGWWRYTNGAQSGTFNLTAPLTGGQYEFRYLQNNGYTSVATSNTVTVSGSSGYTLTASPGTVTPGGALSVSWTAPSGRPAADWIGLYKVGDPNTAYGWWRYTQGAVSGSFNLTAPSTAGQYEFRYLQNNGYTSVATSNTVTIAP